MHAPDQWHADLADDERSVLEDEICIIRAEQYFARARLISTGPDPERDGWVRLSRDDFTRMLNLWMTPGREDEPAYPGRLATRLPDQPIDTLDLPVAVHTDQVGCRPYVLLGRAERPGGIDQR